MKKSSERMTKKEAEKRARRSVSSVHLIVAVVAIIECLLLVSFTTFSWIESNSSLIIQNGPASSQVDTNISKKMDIADSLHSVIDLTYSTSDPFAPVNTFFSEVQYFEFANATSSDGKTLFFPCRNNTYSEAGKYRKADTIDYNTSYIYFDFILRNKATGNNNLQNVENRDVYFDETAGYTDIFTVTGDGLTAEQKTALTNAMRMSITTQVNNGASNTKIYSKRAYSGMQAYNPSEQTGSYQSIDVTDGTEQNPGTLRRSFAYDENHDANNHDRNTWVTTNKLSDSVYHTTNNVIDSEKLFVAKKNADTKVSVRIWFDVFDPEFRSVFSLDSLDYSQYATSEAAYWSIPEAQIGIKFRFKTSGNDLRSVYFDDYTFTNATGINVHHLTDENPNYNVWFYCYQPYVAASIDHPERTAGYYRIKLEKESSDAIHTVWTANTATASEMEYLMGSADFNDAGANNSNNRSTRYQKSYFCYGDFNNNQALYRWELPAAPESEGFTFNAYSYMPNSNYTPASASNGWIDCSKASGATIRRGVGIWQDDDGTATMTLLKFRDMATVVTNTAYNGGDNYQIMNAAASTAHAQHQYLVYANNYNNATMADNFTDNVAKTTAAMYYDTEAQVFKSYVPAKWLSGVSPGVSFTYSPGGTFSANGATLRWYHAAPQQTDGEYIFTALGYSNRYNVDSLGGISYTANVFNSSDGFLKGVGTWRDVELITFSTELIDTYTGANALGGGQRYFIGITDSYSAGYYVMIPDESHMSFSAYVPTTEGETTPGINFVRMSTVKTTSSNNTTAPTAYWYANARSTAHGTSYSTFYPVSVVNAAANPAVYTRGYWNLSVLVDGTYENLIYDTLTDGAHDNGNPVATYNPIVTSGSSTVQGSVDYSPRDNYGLLEYSYDEQNWTTLADDTTDTLTNCLDRYRFYVPAEGQTTVYWRWTAYKSYTVTFYADWDDDLDEYRQKTITAADTQFKYEHDVTDASSTGIYRVVTEAPYIPSNNNP